MLPNVLKEIDTKIYVQPKVLKEITKLFKFASISISQNMSGLKHEQTSIIIYKSNQFSFIVLYLYSYKLAPGFLV